MNDKLEKKEWWDLLKGASFFAVVLTLIVNEYSYKSMDSTIYVIACVAELLIFLTAIGVDYVRYVVINEPIKKMEPEKMERRRKRLKWGDSNLCGAGVGGVLLAGDHGELSFIPINEGTSKGARIDKGAAAGL